MIYSGFGSVVSAKDSRNSDKKRIAIKKLPHTTPRNKQNNLSEIGFLATFRHPNIVNFMECYYVNEEIWIVMEYLEGGTLAEAAKAHKFTDKHCAYVAREMLKALTVLHEAKVGHRDLKSSNVMMSVTGEIKLSIFLFFSNLLVDFGLCADFTEGPERKMCGSPYWMPPEMIKSEYHNHSVDIWSLGVCLLELYLNAPPYSESSFLCMYKVATVGLHSRIPSECTPMAVDFLQKCLTIKPEDRPLAADLLEVHTPNTTNNRMIG